MKSLIVLGIAFLGIVLGMLAALIGGVPTLVLFAMVAPLLLLLKDYRVGVVALTLLLPWSGSPLLPQAQGLNVINYLVLLSTILLVVPRLFRRTPLVPLPQPLVWLYLLPSCMGLVVAWPHIPEGAINFAGTATAASFNPMEFLKVRFLKPLGWVVYAFLLANAVRDSKKPERWIAVLAVSALMPTAVVFGGVLMFGGDLTELQSRRGFLSGFGLHANDFGLLLMTACIPMMFMMAAARGARRVAWALVFLLCLGGLVLTFSRGAWLGTFVAAVMFLVRLRKLRVFLIALPLLALVLAIAPRGVIDRLATGIGEDRDTLVYSQSDELTAGRVASWRLLAPEIERSPIMGRGIGSTAWSTAVRDHLYRPNHPHNLYLSVAMDLGLVGLVALGWLWFRYLRAARYLAQDEATSPTIQAVFAGVRATLVAFLVMGFTNCEFMPSPQQTYLWFSLGLLFAFWTRSKALQRERASAARRFASHSLTPTKPEAA